MKQYEYGVDPWRVERWDLVEAEIPGITVADLPRLHAALAPHPRQWLVARRLWGIQPLIPTQTINPDDLITLAAPELAEMLAVPVKQIAAELSAVRALAKAALAGEPEPEPEGEFRAPLSAAPDGNLTLDLGDTALFSRYDVVVPSDTDDRHWLAKRVGEWRKVLDQPQAKPLALAALDTMLQLRRIQREMATVKVGEKSYPGLSRLKVDNEEALRRTMEQLDAIVPYFGMIAGKVSFHGVAADIILGHQEYTRDGTTRLVDGIFTITEVEVLLRRSVQRPEVQYRAGWVAYLNEARANLWNPQWQPRSDHRLLRRMDTGFAAAITAALNEDGVRVPDLLSDDPVDGEYPPLTMETELKGES